MQLRGGVGVSWHGRNLKWPSEEWREDIQGESEPFCWFLLRILREKDVQGRVLKEKNAPKLTIIVFHCASTTVACGYEPYCWCFRNLKQPPGRVVTPLVSLPEVVKATDLPEAAILATCLVGENVSTWGVSLSNPQVCSRYILDGGNSNIFYVQPYLGKIPILTNIFQMGWNHQPVYLIFFGGEVSHNLETQLYILSNNSFEWHQIGGNTFISLTLENHSTCLGRFECKGIEFLKEMFRQSNL